MDAQLVRAIAPRFKKHQKAALRFKRHQKNASWTFLLNVQRFATGPESRLRNERAHGEKLCTDTRSPTKPPSTGVQVPRTGRGANEKLKTCSLANAANSKNKLFHRKLSSRAWADRKKRARCQGHKAEPLQIQSNFVQSVDARSRALSSEHPVEFANEWEILAMTTGRRCRNRAVFTTDFS